MRRLALLLLLLPAGYCRADACDQLAPPSVVVKRLDEPFKVSAQYGFRVLSIMGDKIARPGSVVLGLTRGTATVRFETRFLTVTDRSGQWECASPQITMSYGFSPMTVFMANEFQEGSCAYKEIYQHELRHVKAYQAHLVSIEKDLADTLTARFATGGPARSLPGEFRSRLQQELVERWTPFIKREMNKVDDAQRLIDTPEEYERVAGTCGGAIRKLTGQASGAPPAPAR